jgi:hypothetical protein
MLCYAWQCCAQLRFATHCYALLRSVFVKASTLVLTILEYFRNDLFSLALRWPKEFLCLVDNSYSNGSAGGVDGVKI